MKNFTLKSIFASTLIALSTNLFSQDLGKPFRDLLEGGQSNSSNEVAVLQSQNRTGDYSIQSCQYRTQRGFDFTVNIRANPCPRTVFINVQTMQVQVPNY
jgi:hypothetical protein